MQYAWFIWSIILLAAWLLVFVSLGSQELRRKMLTVSLWTALLGLTEPLFVPAYWNPMSLLDLAARTGFDVESLIFAFSIGGIAVVLYDRIFRTAQATMPETSRHDPRHRYHLWAILCAPIIFVVLSLITRTNPIYSASIALVLGGLATWYCRPDLKKKMIVSAFLFLGLYFFYFLSLTAAYPGYVEKVWNLKVISGVLVAGVPLEELMFAISFGFLWSSIYEHFTWR
jgi:hypothetical protein